MRTASRERRVPLPAARGIRVVRYGGRARLVARSLRKAGQLVVEERRRLDTEVVVLEIEPLVRCVRVLVGLAEAHEEARLAGDVRDRTHERDRSPLANEHGRPPEGFREGALGDVEYRVI